MADQAQQGRNIPACKAHLEANIGVFKLHAYWAGVFVPVLKSWLEASSKTFPPNFPRMCIRWHGLHRVWDSKPSVKTVAEGKNNTIWGCAPDPCDPQTVPPWCPLLFLTPPLSLPPSPAVGLLRRMNGSLYSLENWWEERENEERGCGGGGVAGREGGRREGWGLWESPQDQHSASLLSSSSLLPPFFCYPPPSQTPV